MPRVQIVARLKIASLLAEAVQRPLLKGEVAEALLGMVATQFLAMLQAQCCGKLKYGLFFAAPVP